MTVSVITFEPFKNDHKWADFEDELQKRTQSIHRFADNVIFAIHEGSSRDLFDALTAAARGSVGDLVVIEAKGVQDNSWRGNARTFDWLNEALPDHEFQREVKW
ncbi:hypothetical protein ROV94_04650 [Stenotrophomonas maltophilia]|uniref:hypothetical protein n=1 Tax=Stenotrophomonas maltophilia TaxID=40324 RepID=UPI002894BDE4|nr:hypothetical protein [Stenotrophomonas maltophilia]MDT3430172.1 hypothetical protein [Stenotrophomonas maltophilia]